jgi:hypothetical protein
MSQTLTAQKREIYIRPDPGRKIKLCERCDASISQSLLGMDTSELARWTRFAAKGGIGKCIAIKDCVAQEPDDLMFLQVSIIHSWQTLVRE